MSAEHINNIIRASEVPFAVPRYERQDGSFTCGVMPGCKNFMPSQFCSEGGPLGDCPYNDKYLSDLGDSMIQVEDYAPAGKTSIPGRKLG